ncbi:MAG: leucine-rich repeat domain-containing protein [Oscillospiraceae bacterium]|nr:leucine-rich repeat domain-containing protein [Oscillospiraceae bacterium]
MNKIVILVGIIMVLFIGVVIYSVVFNQPEPPPELEEPCENTVIIAGAEYKIDATFSLALEWTPLSREDIWQISRLINLTSLELKVCDISDISAFSRLVNLTRLDLRVNSISDLTPLTNLENLTHLNLSHNNITDVRPLEWLTELAELELGANIIADISPLYGKLPNLRNLFIYDNAKDTRGRDILDEYTHGAAIRAQFPGATVHF